MRTRADTYDLPTPLWIGLVVLGFIVFWPLGFMALIYLIWSGKMRCCVEKMECMNGNAFKHWKGSRDASRSTGNVAFDEYRETTLKRLDEERQEFTKFVERLRRAKDQDEFERFLSEQESRQSQA